ncbi:MAG TPA: OsmC family protein [Nocardioidaceae bacterium]
MSEHVAEIRWRRAGRQFAYETYARDHEWRFENGLVVSASANPAYLGSASRVDPEEAFVAALSSCHMLTFLAIAARKRFVVDEYVDHAVGVLEKNADGRMAITRVTLHPEIGWSGDPPDAAALATMHRLSHEQCFIANSVTTDVTVAGIDT